MTIKLVKNFGDRGGWWVVAQVGLFGLILLALRRNADPVVAIQIVGWTAIALALLLGGSGMWMIRRRITAMPAPLDGAVLMDGGPYGLVRHPIYGGVILGFVGLTTKGGNVYALGLSLLLIPFFYAKSRHEERLLEAQFPEYDEYRLRVTRRVLPWLL